MIQCPNCSRENADNFNFCLDCGFDLLAHRQELAKAPPPVAAPAYVPPPAPAPVAPPPAASLPLPSYQPNASGSEICPACAHPNVPGVRFCAQCGKRLDGGDDVTQGHQATMFLHDNGAPQTGGERIAKLVTIDQSGREGVTYALRAGETLCGRVNGVILFYDDPFVSPTHALFKFHGGHLSVLDQGSLNGVYLRVRAERKLVEGEYVRAGRQLYRFESLTSAAVQVRPTAGDDSQVWGSPMPHAFGRLVQILDDGRTGEIRLLTGERIQLGREHGDIVVPTDGFVSGRHCVFSRVGNDTFLTDLGSSNGTYVRVTGETAVGHGDFLLVGNQMLRIEIL